MPYLPKVVTMKTPTLCSFHQELQLISRTPIVDIAPEVHHMHGSERERSRCGIHQDEGHPSEVSTLLLLLSACKVDENLWIEDGLGG